MLKRITFLAVLMAVAAAPAMAASKNPFSADFWTLGNTDLIVSIGFLVFLGVLAYFKVPGMLNKMLDQRAEGIRSDLDEAKALREEAQTLLASYERKQAEVQEQADRIVETARKDAEAAAEKAREDIKTSVARRLAAAEEQIESAKASAVKDVRDAAVAVAIAAAQDVLAKQMDEGKQDELIAAGIAQAGQKLH